MQRSRIYSPEALRTGATLVLAESATTHITRVLRLGAGDPIILFDGTGIDYAATIVAPARKGVTVLVGAGEAVDRESPLQLSLLQGISRGPRMDLVVQKATELGVSLIQPILTERSVVRLDAERSTARLQHWHNIVISACEQCGRSVLPEVREPVDLVAAVAGLAAGTPGFMLDPDGDTALDQLRPGSRQIALAIGPEGGFTESERVALTRAGFGRLRLGPRILRTETAPLAALSILQFACGDLGSRGV
ncbi:MAG: 16S rRNA (uracil(1498)-N(3))-methyltransferase [Gammaproteobacteria bacterium]|nr:16S rRNA (uracil(1498)-N(3))-methyltransferase [Gammaproteobacteria bacterium]